MFKNRALHIEMVPKQLATNVATVPDAPAIDPEQINNLLKDQVRNIGLTVVAVMAAGTLLGTMSEIAIKRTPSR